VTRTSVATPPARIANGGASAIRMYNQLRASVTRVRVHPGLRRGERFALLGATPSTQPAMCGGPRRLDRTRLSGMFSASPVP